MGELLATSVSVPNLAYTVVLAMVFLYWGFYLFGALGSDLLDFFDLEVDADVDVDVDVDGGGVEVSDGGNAMASFLRFFLVGDVPVVLILSILILSMWTTSMVVTHYLGITSGWLALALLVPNCVLGLALTKIVLTPFLPILKNVFDQTGDRVQVLGRTCTIVSREATPLYGQAEVQMRGAPLLLNVRTLEGETLAKGEEAVIYEHDEENHVYKITTLELRGKNAAGEEADRGAQTGAREL